MQASLWTTAADALHLAKVSIISPPHQTLSTSLARYQTMASANCQVLLRLARDGNALVFEASASGIGIAPEDILRLFESFYRGSNVGNLPGSGLGLAIVKRSADLHRGSMEVASTVGEGSMLTVRIPVLNGNSG